MRATGGLADTVVDETARPNEGNGFVFADYSTAALLNATRRAVEFYRLDRAWTALRERGMVIDLSWSASATQYAALYGSASAH